MTACRAVAVRWPESIDPEHVYSAPGQRGSHCASPPTESDDDDVESLRGGSAHQASAASGECLGYAGDDAEDPARRGGVGVKFTREIGSADDDQRDDPSARVEDGR